MVGFQRISLVLLNLGLLLVGLTCLALAIWLAADGNDSINDEIGVSGRIRGPINPYYTTTEKVFNIIAGAGATFVGLLGLLLVVTKNLHRRYLTHWWVFWAIFTFLFLAFSAGIWCLRMDKSFYEDTDPSESHALFAIELFLIVWLWITVHVYVNKSFEEFAIAHK
jgi:hypothetical protein